MTTRADSMWTCAVCGQRHRGVVLRPGQVARCVRCATTLARRPWLGRGGAMPFLVSALVLAVPAAALPFVVLGKFGRGHVSYLQDLSVGMWNHGMEWLALWIAFCGTAAPVTLAGLILLGAARGAGRASRDPTRWLAGWFAYWTMPEVLVLGVLVAFFKLGDVVNVAVGPGLWAYAAAAVSLLLAWRRFDHVTEPGETRPPGRAGAKP